jgi:hypothetical protein
MAEVQNPGTVSQKWTDYLSAGNAKVGMRVETLSTQRAAPLSTWLLLPKMLGIQTVRRLQDIPAVNPAIVTRMEGQIGFRILKDREMAGSQATAVSGCQRDRVAQPMEARTGMYKNRAAGMTTFIQVER